MSNSWQKYTREMLKVRESWAQIRKAADLHDTFPAWLRHRFEGRRSAQESGTYRSWEELRDEEKDYWVHEAAAVRRAVNRSGFKTPEATEQLRSEVIMTSLAYGMLKEIVEAPHSGFPERDKQTLRRLIAQNEEKMA